MMGKERIKSHTTELRELLWDIFTFRGKRMLDIGIYQNPITISIRYCDHDIASSDHLARIYLKEFEVTYKEIYALVNGYFIDDLK